MLETYVEVALHASKNLSQNKIAQELCVQVQRLQFKLNSHRSAGIIHGLHLMKLAPDHEKALHNDFI